MRSADSWFAEYGESHQDPVNKRLHWICVPLIFWSVVALLWSIPHPAGWPNWAIVVAIAAQVWYVALSPRLSVGIGVFMLACLGICWGLEAGLGIAPWIPAIIVFVAAWIGQFIGHHIEGARPSFFKDLQFLLVGPAWLMGFVYRTLGWRY